MIHSKPYTKDSGVKITKENPYFTYPGRRFRRAHEKSIRPRKNPYNGEYLQIIGDWDPVHHKLINQRRIVHKRKYN